MALNRGRHLCSAGRPSGWALAHILVELRFDVLLDTKQIISDTFAKPIFWLGMEKQNLSQQKHTFTNQKKCTTTQNKHKKKKPQDENIMSPSAMQGSHKKTKARFRCLLRHPARKCSGPILVLRFINLSLTYLLTHLLTYLQPQTHRGTGWPNSYGLSLDLLYGCSTKAKTSSSS